MKSVLIRVIISLFLCCCIVLNVFSLPASATSVAVVAGLAAIPTAVAVACAFQALGFMSASNSTDFTTTVDSCSNWLTANSSFVVNGAVSLLGLTNAGVTTSYLQKSFVQDVWEWLFSSNTVNSYSVNSLASVPYTTITGGTIYPQGDYKLYRVSWYDSAYSTFYSATVVLMISGSTYKTSSSGSSVNCDRLYVGSTAYYYHVDYTAGSLPGCYYLGSISSADYNKTPHKAIGNYLWSHYLSGSLPAGYVSTQDITLGLIESPFVQTGTETEEETIQIEIAPIYIDWTKYGVPDPNDPGGDDPDNDGKFPMWLPTGIPSPGYDDSVITQNQQQAQSGVVSGDITFEPYEPSNPGSGNGSGNTGTNTGTNFFESLTQFFTPSGDITMYSLDLKELFPFCIPFDIYNFLAALSADPVPPVFEFDLNLGVATEPMKIDLSNWSDLAAIIRTLELGLFCVGLALKTRELIGG